MIKYFQKLKAKKGFTLVELIVVIAIIGVLAAILIPTMLGYVTQSKVTSANSTASSIKNEIDGFLTTCDTNGYGMKKGSGNKEVVQIVITENSGNPLWTVTLAKVDDFNTKGGKAWNTSGASNVADGKAAPNISGVLALDLKELFPEVKSGVIKAQLVGGKCMGVIYTTEHNNPATGVYSKFSGDGFATWPVAYGWSNQTPGIDTDGSIVGSAPVLQLAATPGALSS